MTPKMIKILNQTYNKSNKDKVVFFNLIYKNTGLKAQAFEQGLLKVLIDTLIWK